MMKLTAKQYLKQGYKLNELINSYIEELDQLRALSTSISSPSVSDMPSGGSGNKEPAFVKAIMKIVELEKKINDKINKYVDLKNEISETIEQLSNTEEKVLLRCRYINFYTWETICEKLNVSMRTVHRIHASALQNVKLPK